MTLSALLGPEGCMAYREVTMLEVKEVLRLWLSGVHKKRTAAQLGLKHQDGPAVPARRAGARPDHRRPARRPGRRTARRRRQHRPAGDGAAPWRRLGGVRHPRRRQRVVDINARRALARPSLPPVPRPSGPHAAAPLEP